MYSIIKKMLFVVMVIVFTSTSGFSVDFDIGQIIEISEDNKYIQVHDKVYKISSVELLSEENSPPVLGTSQNLREGSIVKVIQGTKEDDYWNSTLVTVYLGEMKKMIREEMELPVNKNNERTEKTKTKPAPYQSIKLKDGVWTN